MPDLKTAFEVLRDFYIAYYETPFELRDPGLSAERRSLLLTEGEIFRKPLLELATGYASSGRTLAAAAEELGISGELAEFAAQGLFPSDLTLYEHQYESLRAATAERSFVVTAGTGSGKTEAFLLPVVRRLVDESRAWGSSKVGPNTWWDGTGPWVSQRRGDTRDAAIRCIVLYPMNALVEDQLRRLREALDGPGARDWLDTHRGGNRFYFGRYTGRTPGSGEVGSKAVLAELRELMKSQEATADHVVGDPEKRYSFPRLDGGEMRSRWDMIVAPPDILITNYSMLNVMLMREREESMFRLTREWLSRNRAEHVLTLVVDELHMYRGTAGTEIALLLRNLRHRLELDSHPEQLRIYAASASLSGDERGLSYVREFFAFPGFEARDFFAGRAADPPAPIARRLPLHHEVLKSFPSRWDSASENERRLIVAELADELEVQRPSAELDAPTALRFVVDDARLAGEVVAAFGDGDRRPLPYDAVAARLFAVSPTDDDPMSHDATLGGLLRVLAEGRSAEGEVALRLRAHLFFRNIRGAWACSDPSCPAVPDGSRSAERRIGKLYLQPQLRCTEECGARVLELLYCEICGEAFLGGYRSKAASLGSGAALTEYLLPDQPNLELLPDGALVSRSQGTYLFYWPSTETPADLSWKMDGVTFEFKPAHYEPKTGKITRKKAGATGWILSVTLPNVDLVLPAMPSRCPKCGEDSAWPPIVRSHMLTLPERLRSSIRTMGTGFERISQVLADGLIRQTRETTSSPKLVVFSDSRQDAAKLSTGLEASHYQDLVRQLVSQLLEDMGGDLDGYATFLETGQASSKADSYKATHPQEAMALLLVRQNMASDAEKATAKRVLATRDGPWPVSELLSRAEGRLLDLGVNPAGPDFSLQKFYVNKKAHSWTEAFDFASEPPREKSGLIPEQKTLLNDIRIQLRDQIRFTLFARRGRDLESLGLGWATFPRVIDPASVSSIDGRIVQEAADGVIRILGTRYRIDDGEHMPATGLPKYVREYLEHVGACKGVSASEVTSAVVQVLTRSGAMVTGFLLSMDQIHIARGHEPGWECDSCRRVHLHHAGGVCTNPQCLKRLTRRASPTSTDVVLGRDYFEVLARSAGAPFRLHCEELTGQTDLDDSLRRQRLFRNVILEDDNDRVDAIDLLSVTTTMEAGVDIGDLQAVMMSNMPPRRFNYQQRVGRAGRRKDPLSMAVTVCRGRTHDDFYFRNPERITGDPPPQPYIDLTRPEIVRRVINAEVLRLAFQSLKISTAGDDAISVDLGRSSHGQFGKVDEWAQHRPAIRRWLSSDAGQASIRRTVDALLDTTPEEVLARRDTFVDAATSLCDQIDAATFAEGVFQEELAELLANRGILPMFGFPSRTRLLHQWYPSARDWPPTKNVIARDLDIAISQFAPGAQTIKDKAVYTSVGIVGYVRKGPRLEPVPDDQLLASPSKAGLCRNCQALTTENVTSCPVCGEENPAKFAVHDLIEPTGFRTDYGRGKPYTGQFEWTPQASRARLSEGADIGSPVVVPGLGVIVRSGNGLVYAINDNGGSDFTLQKHPNEAGWIVAETYERPPQGLDPQTAVKRALASITTTDVLVLGLDDGSVPPGVSVAPVTAAGRAAWYSFGFLLRLAAAEMLDIDLNELRVGLRVKRENQVPKAEVFISDALENGAGYSTFLARPDILLQLFERIGPASKPNTRAAQWSGHRQAGKICDSSCHDCLRDYSNMAFHGLLDWRLALDMADIASHRPLVEQRWLNRAAEVRQHLCDGFGWKGRDFAGIPSILREDDGLIQILTHPLWDTRPQFMGPALALAYDDAQNAFSGYKVETASLFDAVRRPGILA